MAIQQGLTLRGWHYIHWGGRAMVHIMGCMYTYSILFRIGVPSLSFVPWLSMYLAFSMIKIQVLRQPSLVRLYCASCPILWTVLKLGVILSGCQTFNTFENRFFFYIFLSRFFFVYSSGLGTFDTKFVSRDLILWELITCTWQVKWLKV